ncbi:hypothetical protein DNI29_20105 [Hymenobacter sediminis]|uniref:hypothetical protein n=1 Tax=Hymenobacter sediminis TaxID=2218621 RepID=UPI000DA67CD6|nr:hypothetical protein [Hymenobacter sediminis]RPD44998.1 hypothetical protein DNI29_20105 [Hymenobacter sediminis]
MPNSLVHQELRQSYPLVGYTHLTLGEAGLSVEQTRFFNRTELLIPYEDLLPIGRGRHHNFPFRLTLAALFVGFGCLKAVYMLIMQPNHRESAGWLLLLLLGVLAVVVYQALQLWRHDFLLTTGRGNIILFDSRRNRVALESFVTTLRDHTHAALLNRYAIIDALLPAEPQLSRLQWLHSLGVLTESQFHNLKTRLIGRFYGSENILGSEHGLAPSEN